MKAKILILSLLGWSLLASAGPRDGDFSSVVVFGDSLSDPGNYFHLFGEQAKLPFEPDNVPSAPYPMGGHHFTNGKTWIEQLTRRMEMSQSGSPAMVAPGVFTNYAVGRSRARDILLQPVFHEENLTSQVDRFLADTQGVMPPDTLYTVWIGSNDVADALGAYLAQDSKTGEAIIRAALSNTALQLGKLYHGGARHFLIPNMPDFALTPRVRNLAAASCAPHPVPDLCHQQVLKQVSMVSAAYNGGLQMVLLGLMHQLPGLSVQLLDVAAFLHQVAADPAAYGFENVQDACVVPDTRQQVFCGKAADYLFWDGQHPTKAGHKALAKFALQELAGK